jgi:serine/threonine-protein kinase
MFLDEAKLLLRLVHPNVVRTLGVGAEGPHSFIAMELLLGTTLGIVQHACAQQSVGLHPVLTAWIGARTADALHYAHELADEQGKPLHLVHRDVSPENVFATFDGRVKLIDFGLAKYVGRARATSPGIVKGKLSYLSPEQIMQLQVDRRSDVFGLGTTIWEMLTMRRLFRRESDEATVRAVQRGPIPDPREIAPDVSEKLVAIVMRALERNRENRYATAADLRDALDGFVNESVSIDPAKALVETLGQLFPDEKKRQMGWLKPSPSRSMPPPAPRSIPPTSRSVPPTSSQSVPPTSQSVPPTSQSVPPTSSRSVPPPSRSVPPPSRSLPKSLPLPSASRSPSPPSVKTKSVPPKR